MGHPSRELGFSETGKGGRRDRLMAGEENKHQTLISKFWYGKLVRQLATIISGLPQSQSSLKVKYLPLV